MTKNIAPTTAPARTFTGADGSEIAVHIRNGGEMVFLACGKCGGSGYLPGYEFSDNARCWGCMTVGGRWITVERATANAKARKRAADKRRRDAEAAAAAALAARDDFRTANPTIAFLADDLTAVTEWQNGRAFIAGEWVNPILLDLSTKLRRYDSLSAAQIRLAEKLVAEQAERKAKRDAERENAHPAPAGRVTVTGEVLGTKEIDGDYGIVFKMRVRSTDGYTVYVSVPSAMDLPEKGARVRFTATLIPADDDPTFAFGKRPTKGEILA